MKEPLLVKVYVLKTERQTTLFHRSDEKLNQSLNEMLQTYILSDTESCQSRYLICLMTS